MRPGVDVVAIDRIATVVARRPRFLTRVYTSGELQECTRDGVDPASPSGAARLAGRWAAKEAARKALGVRLSWRDIEVRNGPHGIPALWVAGAPAPATLSFAHDGGVAVAFVIAEEAIATH
ncbi:MAG: holo-ACP synthase [Actinomycetota bacterium]|nr:holo-ACP synthase [Actinomycetota bacterium]